MQLFIFNVPLLSKMMHRNLLSIFEAYLLRGEVANGLLGEAFLVPGDGEPPPGFWPLRDGDREELLAIG